MTCLAEIIDKPLKMDFVIVPCDTHTICHRRDMQLSATKRAYHVNNNTLAIFPLSCTLKHLNKIVLIQKILISWSELIAVLLEQLQPLSIQLFRERLSEKVHATIPKGIVGGFEFTVLQRNLKELARKAMKMCLRVLKESNKSRFDSLSRQKQCMIISHITFRDCRVHIFPTTFLEIAVYIQAYWKLIKTISTHACDQSYSPQEQIIYNGRHALKAKLQTTELNLR